MISASSEANTQRANYESEHHLLFRCARVQEYLSPVMPGERIDCGDSVRAIVRGDQTWPSRGEIRDARLQKNVIGLTFGDLINTLMSQLGMNFEEFCARFGLAANELRAVCEGELVAAGL